MKWKSAFMYTSIVVTIVKLLILFFHEEFRLALGWLGAGSWFVLIGFAMHSDRDLPMVGTFKYHNGSNQTARYFASFFMTAVFGMAAIFSR